jgi:hypothetical protein
MHLAGEENCHQTRQYEIFFHIVFSLVNKAANSPSWMSRKRSGLRPPSFGLDLPLLSTLPRLDKQRYSGGSWLVTR